MKAENHFAALAAIQTLSQASDDAIVRAPLNFHRPTTRFLSI